MNATRLLPALFAIAVSSVASAAFAQYSGEYWPTFVGASIYSTESVPYYALHPPVYYSARIPRTYGYSPYAYPSGILTPGSELVLPANVCPSLESYEGQQKPPPLRIDNPFVERREKVPTAEASPLRRSPKVVYPASLALRTK